MKHRIVAMARDFEVFESIAQPSVARK